MYFTGELTVETYIQAAMAYIVRNVASRNLEDSWTDSLLSRYL